MSFGTSSTSAPDERKVVIVGGGIAGIEALMALDDLGGGRLRLHLVASHPSFVLRPQIVGAPWGGPPLTIDLARLCRAFGADFSLATVTGVDAMAHAVLTTGDSIGYDRLLVAAGAQPALAYGETQTLGFGVLPSRLAAAGSGTVAILAPAGVSWTLPAYELALLTAGSSRDVRVLTDEAFPLEAFGFGTTDAVRSLLARHGIPTEPGGAPKPGAPVAELADTVIALPLLNGPALTGVPSDSSGFLLVDSRMAVVDVEDVYGAGDATNGPIKQGGLASQQADTAASGIVRSCGGTTPEAAITPTLRGKLTAPDGEDLYLSRALDGVDLGSTSAEPLWQPSGAVCAQRLSRWLDYRRDELDRFTVDHVARPLVA